MKYKALLLDVDGTLIRNDQTVSVGVAKALAGLVDKGVSVGIASGRPFFAFKKYLEQLGLKGLHIAMGGAQIVDYPSEEVKLERTIKASVARAIYKEMNDLGALVILQDGKYQYQDTNRIADPEFPAEYREVEKLKDWNVPKMIVRGVGEDWWDRLQKYKEVYLHGRYKFRHFDGVWTDVTAKKVNKQAAVLEWARLAKVRPGEVVGVGDGNNDVPLLNAVGCGVAMGNGIEDLKAMADFVAPSVDEDGVATVVEKFFS